MSQQDCERKLRILSEHAWDQEVRWPEIEAWQRNFVGDFFPDQEEQLHSLYALSCFMYFSRRLVREMLRSLFRDKIEAPILHSIRRAQNNSRDAVLLRYLLAEELKATRFIPLGNPSESGAHILYFFRQINHLPKGLFVDLSSAFAPMMGPSGSIHLVPRDPDVKRYVFVDDLVGSGTQARAYLEKRLEEIRLGTGGRIEISFRCLFATSHGLRQLNKQSLFDGKADCLFELDKTYRAFSKASRYFNAPPAWFSKTKLFQIARGYGKRLRPSMPLGYKRGQLLLGFSYNTPDNVPPIFWHGDFSPPPWKPIFTRYDKIYGVGAP